MKNQLLVISAVCLGLISVNAFAVGHSNHDKMMMDDDKTMITTMETPMLPTIVENAVATESVSTLVAAVQAAGLVDTLNSEGPFTVFAPTNSAFEKLPVGTVETLLQPENIEQLQSILTYHVLAGEVHASDIKDSQVVSTVQGEKLYISVRNGKVFINGSMVEVADVKSSNGVIHIIDGVILPLSSLTENQVFKVKAEAMLAGKFSKLSLEKQIQILDMLNMYYDEKVKNTTISDEKKVKLQDKIEVLKNIMLSVQ